MTLTPNKSSDEGWSRRQLGQLVTAGAVAAISDVRVLGATRDETVLQVDPAPRFPLSPYLYMQFMEPLGTTDGSVEAAWDHLHDNWRKDVVETTADLAPTMMRWGGIFTDFYRWREGVGPRNTRPPMLNLCWGGIESNQVGTAEFVDFCQRVAAEPLMCVNFESDGRSQYKQAKGSVRTADAQEAAQWVAYCNQPNHDQRRTHGNKDPLTIRYWQLGNETSYDGHGFDLEKAALKTVEFSKAMRAVDASIKVIAWGDSGWAPRMWEVAGEHVDMLAFHQMFDPDSRQNPVLRGERYRRDVDATWHQLMEAWKINDHKIREVRDSLDGAEIPLAMTECHFAIPGRDRCDVLSTWAAGVSYARILNNHQRHGDLLKIATAADFCGTRWQVNAVMIPVPRGTAYLMPVARVMRLYRRHIGDQAVRVTATPPGLDAVASRNGNKFFIHVVNTQRTRSIRTRLQIAELSIQGGSVHEIVDEPMIEVSQLNSSTVMQTNRRELPEGGVWEFPPASVSAVEIDVT